MTHTPATYARFVYRCHGAQAERLLSLMLANGGEGLEPGFLQSALYELDRLRVYSRDAVL